MDSRITLTHGCSLSNLPLFVAEAAGLFEAEGLDVQVPRFTTLSSSSDIIASGVSDLGTVAFTEPLIDASRDNPPIIVGGSGLMGITVMAQPEITDAGQLKGRRAGTFRRDPLEVLLHDALAVHGLGFDDLEIVYLDDIEDALAEFENGTIDAITLAEPHATRLARNGAVLLSDGTELWGDPFPDTVLVATARFLESRPEHVSAALRAMIRAEEMIAPIRTACSIMPCGTIRTTTAPIWRPAHAVNHPASTFAIWNTRFTIAGIRSSRWGSSLEATGRRPTWFRSICWRRSWNARAAIARIPPETKHNGDVSYERK